MPGLHAYYMVPTCRNPGAFAEMTRFFVTRAYFNSNAPNRATTLFWMRGVGNGTLSVR
jgi:hypothetical protein